MTPKELWEMAEENQGLVVDYDSVSLAIARRHSLHRYRQKNGGFSAFQVRLVGSSLHIQPTNEKVRALDGRELAKPSSFDEGFSKLRLNLETPK